MTSIEPIVLLRAVGLVGLPIGLLLGAVLGPAAWRGREDHGSGACAYCSWTRRCVRLAHVAAIVLPLIALVWALALQAWGPAAGTTAATVAAAGAWLHACGAVAMVVLLVIAARVRPVALALPVPATAILLAAGCTAWAVLS